MGDTTTLLRALVMPPSVERRPPEIQLAPVSRYPRTPGSHQHPGIGGDCYQPVTFGQLGSLRLLPPLPTI